MEINVAIDALSALAQETRLAIFRYLVQAGPAGARPGRIGQALGLAPATLSFHLAQLSHAGLLSQRREGRRIIYSVQFDTMNALMGFLTENCCGGEAGACAPGTATCRPEEILDETSARASQG